MVQHLKNVGVDLEVPAPVVVCGLLAVAALTKGGCPEWAIGGMIFLYVLYLAIQYSKGARPVSAGALATARQKMVILRQSAAYLPIAATIVVAIIAICGALVARSPLGHLPKDDVADRPSALAGGLPIPGRKT
jgi:hypothetical protein